MGIVYRATSEFGHEIAIKILHSGTPDGDARFLSEAKSMASIRHPNVIELLGVGELEGRTFMAMEFLHGESLADHLRTRPALTTTEALPILLQICAGVQAAHGAGIVHRDLKPDNVFVCTNGTIKVLDFGISKSLLQGVSPNLTANMVLGTPGYMSPEQATRSATASFAADIFSIGVIAFELLTRTTPYDADSHTSLLTHFRAIQSGSAPQPSIRQRRRDIPEEWIKTIDAAISLDATCRPLTVRTFSSPLIDSTRDGTRVASLVAPSLLRRRSALDETIAGRLAALPDPGGAPPMRRLRYAAGGAAVGAAVVFVVITWLGSADGWLEHHASEDAGGAATGTQSMHGSPDAREPSGVAMDANWTAPVLPPEDARELAFDAGAIERKGQRPRDISALYDAGISALRAKRWKDAVDTATKMLQMEASNVYALRIRGQAACNLGDSEMAADSARRLPAAMATSVRETCMRLGVDLSDSVWKQRK